MTSSELYSHLPVKLRDKLIASGITATEHLCDRTLESLLSVCRIDLSEIAVLEKRMSEAGLALAAGPVRYPFISPLLVSEVASAGVEVSATSITSIGLPSWAEAPLRRGGLDTVGQLAGASTFYVRAALGRGGRPHNIMRQHVEEHLLQLVQEGQSAVDNANGSAGTLQSASLSARTRGALRRSGIFTLAQLERMSEADLRRLPGLGPKSYQEIAALPASSARPPIHGGDLAVQAEAVSVRPAVARRSVRSLDLPNHLIARMESNGLRTIGALVKAGDQRLQTMPRVGDSSIRRIRAELERYLLATLEEVGSEAPIVVAEVEAMARVASLDQRVASLIHLLPNRRLIRILSERSGLGGRVQTLEEIGKELAISRERVRQLEAAALLELRREHQSEVYALSRPLYEAIAAAGGVVDLGYLTAQLPVLFPLERVSATGVTRLLLQLMEEVNQSPGRNVALKNASCSDIDQLDDAMSTYLRKRLEPASISDLTAHLARTAAYPRVVHQYPTFSLAARARSNPHTEILSTGEVTLREWGRTRLNQTIHVLRTLSRPSHFRDIGAGVRDGPALGTEVSLQSIHNLLLSEAVFVRVGRGIFGLAEWQDAPWEVVAELVSTLAASEGPMHLSEIARALKLDERTVERYLLIRPEFSPTGHGYYKLAGRTHKRNIVPARGRVTEVLPVDSAFPGRSARVRITHSSLRSGTIALSAALCTLFPEEGDVQVAWPGSPETHQLRKLHRGQSHLSGLGRFLHTSRVQAGDYLYIHYCLSTEPETKSMYLLYTETQWQTRHTRHSDTDSLKSVLGEQHQGP